MARPFAPTTAELVTDAVEAVFVLGAEATLDYVAAFADQPKDQAKDALEMATDLGLLKKGANSGYVPYSPLCRYTASPNVNQKAAVLRIILDTYEPFQVFKERLLATNNPSTAAEQTKAILDLDAHRADIKDTLINLGGYGQLLISEGGGSYKINEIPAINPLKAIAQACDDTDSAERAVRNRLGDDAVGIVSVADVVQPLSDALWRANAADGSGAIQQAGNAVESFLGELGNRVGADMAGAHGINAKAQRLREHWNLPTKLLNVSKYLGHIRNAADHGVDEDIDAAWDITEETGIEYVFVACSFVTSVVRWELSNSARL